MLKLDGKIIFKLVFDPIFVAKSLFPGRSLKIETFWEAATTNLHPSFSHCYRAFFSHKIVSKHMGMAKSKFFSNSKTHWKIIFFKNFKITKHVTTQDHRVQLNYLRFKKQKIPGHKYISPLWENSDNSFSKMKRYFCAHVSSGFQSSGIERDFLELSRV